MTHDDFCILTETMQRYGGHFMTKLADAIRAADQTNRFRIIHAFPEIVRDFGPDSRFAKSMLADKVNV
jgi:2-oxo-4-hydroxy-4-carboxy--5-ureidoimidazoline (OHCU) decarboxylase